MIEETRRKLEGLEFTPFRGQYGGIPQEYMILEDEGIVLIMKEIGKDKYLAHRGEDIHGTHYTESKMNCDLFNCADDIPVGDLIEHLRNPGTPKPHIDSRDPENMGTTLGMLPADPRVGKQGIKKDVEAYSAQNQRNMGLSLGI